jgi:hypothetical protein
MNLGFGYYSFAGVSYVGGQLYDMREFRFWIRDFLFLLIFFTILQEYTLQ